MKKKKILIIIIILVFCLATGATYYFASRNIETNKEPNTNNQLDENNQEIRLEYELTREADYVAVSVEDLYELVDLVFIGIKKHDVRTYAKNYGMIITETNYSIKKIVKGNYDNDNINIHYYGGYVTLEEYKNSLTTEQAEKHELNTYSKEERLSKYIGYAKSEKMIDSDVNQEYLIFVSYDKVNNIYFVASDAYGMRLINNDLSVYNLDTKTYEKINYNLK